MSMSKTSLTTPFPSADSQEGDPSWWDLALAHATRRRREQLGLTIEAAAELAGLQSSEWVSLEAGWVPWEEDTLHAIASTLQVCRGEYFGLAAIVRIHQEYQES